MSLLIISYSCNKDKNDYTTSKGKLQFSITSENTQKLKLKAASDSSVSTLLTAAVVTIEDASGNIVQNSVSIPLSNMNGSYISNPISLVTGNYQLTGFMLINQSNQVVYASPLKTSKLAYLVTNPLPVSFVVQTNAVTNIAPEVISATDNTPQDFGYATFGFNIDSTFNFLVGAFIYNPTVKNYQLTTASISISYDSLLIYTGQLSATGKDSAGIATPSDSLGITTKIILPAKYNSFTIKISKPNYTTYSKTFTKTQLRQYYLSSNKGPLIVILNLSNISALPVDYDGNVYNTVTIGNQTWLLENLKVTHYNNGDPITTSNPSTLDITYTPGYKFQWAYGGNDTSAARYGRLYTWYAIMDPRGVSPAGWHVPSDSDWSILEAQIGMSEASIDTIHDFRGSCSPKLAGDPGLWQGGGITNNPIFGITGFMGLPAGIRDYSGLFEHINNYADWWSSTTYAQDTTGAIYREVFNYSNGIRRWIYGKNEGFSVRLVKNN